MTAAEQLDAVLATIDTARARAGTSRWRFQLVTRHTATAAIDDGWLVLATRLAAAAQPERAPGLLAANATLTGGVRFACSPRDQALGARADVALDPEVDVAARVREACAGLAMAAACWSGAVFDASDAGDAAAPPSHAVDLAAACRTTGWEGRRRDGVFVVDLDVPGLFPQASIAPAPGGAVTLTVPLFAVPPDAGATSEPGRRALAALLLRLAGIVRLARAAQQTDDPASACFEVALTRPSVPEIGHALSALSVACRLAVVEAAVLLHDETAARHYLHLQPPAARVRPAA